MRSKFLSFLLVMACAGVIGLHPLRAQNPTGSSDANGNAVTAPAKQSGTASAPTTTPKSDQAVPDSKRDADNAIANDRGTAATPVRRSIVGFGLLALLAVLGLISLLLLIRRRSVGVPGERDLRRDSNYRRAA